jgi:hypothetical protein
VIKHLRVRKELWNLSPGAERQPRQLDDPHYFRKVNALYHEFEEVGLNKQLGYACPADLVELFPQFYWKCISPHIQTAIQYLNVTSSGRQWIANLYSNIFRAEKGIHLSGPEH